jgi:signal transduction histidine kinase
LLRGVLTYRWLTLGWIITVFSWEVIQRNGRGVGGDPVARPVIGFAILAGIVAITVWLTVLYRRDPDLLMRPGPTLVEVWYAAVPALADVWVYGSTDHAQALPSVWVVAPIFAIAIAAGRRPALVAAFGLGLARYVGWLPYATDGYWSLSRIASWVLLLVAAWTAGFILNKLEEADRSISAYRAREEVARTLHDGVLQTLAVIQRRSDDAELVELARTQELELREYLFGAAPTETDLAAGLRGVARKAEERYGLRVDVITAPDLPDGSDRLVHAVCGAVREALTNASKHGSAQRATVYAEPSDTAPSDGRAGNDAAVFVSVKDNGVGFDPDQATEGQGLARSIRGRILELGGQVEVDGRPGRGAEIKMWV